MTKAETQERHDVGEYVAWHQHVTCDVAIVAIPPDGWMDADGDLRKFIGHLFLRQLLAVKAGSILVPVL